MALVDSLGRNDRLDTSYLELARQSHEAWMLRDLRTARGQPCTEVEPPNTAAPHPTGLPGERPPRVHGPAFIGRLCGAGSRGRRRPSRGERGVAGGWIGYANL
jgi:hypothetical protein